MAAVKDDRYVEDDFVQVQDAEGKVHPDSVPKSWVGTDLLPVGWKQATAKAVKAADEDTSSSS